MSEGRAQDRPEGPASVESKRDRVRRLLLTPLAELGFRWPKGTEGGEGQRRLDRIADDLGYLSDANLVRLCSALRSKGEGSARCFWPAHATFVAYAQLAQPRPIGELPGLASWFGSAAGRQAEAAGRLVAEFRFWRARHRPPMNDGERRLIATRAGEMRDRVMRLGDRAAHGYGLDDADAAWLEAYRRHEAQALEMVRAAREGAPGEGTLSREQERDTGDGR